MNPIRTRSEIGINIVNKKLINLSQVFFSIRPENIYLESYDRDKTIKVEIIQIENHGHELLMTSKLINNSQLLYFRISKENKITLGSKVTLGFNVEDLLFFDIINERRIK